MDMNWSSFVSVLTERTLPPLPGVEGQLRLAHAMRWPQPLAPEGARQASVMLLVFPIDDIPHTLLIKRTTGDVRDRHSGQISFPGGKREVGDIDLKTTALRETKEEVGVSPSLFNWIHPLTPLYIPVSNFHVHPWLGIIDRRPEFVIQPEEVDRIFEVPLVSFLREDAIRKGEIILGNQTQIDDIPYFDIEGEKLWGATAMIMGEFITWWEHLSLHRTASM